MAFIALVDSVVVGSVLSIAHRFDDFRGVQIGASQITLCLEQIGSSVCPIRLSFLRRFP
jgi:hypothetical protein